MLSNKPLPILDEPDALLLVLEENFPFAFIETYAEIDYVCEH
jgi:hypothetical protein